MKNKRIKTEKEKLKNREYSIAWQQKQADKYPGYGVYYLPEEHYVGMSVNIPNRMLKHKHLGRSTAGWELLCSFENPIEAHLMETRLHLMGYNGYRPLMAKRKASMMGMYNAEDYEEEARIWCNKNGILIYPKPCTRGSPSKWFLVIELKDKIPAQAPDELPRNEVWKKMYEYYMYYFKKHNDERKISKV